MRLTRHPHIRIDQLTRMSTVPSAVNFATEKAYVSARRLKRPVENIMHPVDGSPMCTREGIGVVNGHSDPRTGRQGREKMSHRGGLAHPALETCVQMSVPTHR